MPPFQAPMSSKRKSDQDDISSRKRQATENSKSVSQMNSVDVLSKSNATAFWMVQWRNPQYKKHKTWDGDAILVVHDTKATLYDLNGGVLSSGKANFPIFEGKNFSVGGKEIELDSAITKEDYFSGRCFGSVVAADKPEAEKTGSLSKKFTPLTMNKSSLPSRAGHHQVTAIAKDSPSPLKSIMLSSNITKVTECDIELEKAKQTPQDSFWIANWRKQQQKKHKTWEGDAYISCKNSKITMISEDGKIIGSIPWRGQALQSGHNMIIGGKEVELGCPVLASELPIIAGKSNAMVENAAGIFNESEPSSHKIPEPVETKFSETKKVIPPSSFYGTLPKSKPKEPLHDPEAEGAVVMKPPTKEHNKRFNPKNLSIVPVVLDPILSRRMREHQIEGVKFMYECVMSLRKHEGQGCILADEMGLGKTLQTIALVWTLLKQNPYASTTPVVQKVLIVCPVSLVNNWKMEFHKWLGKDRVGVAIAEKDNKGVSAFMHNKSFQVLITGYERLKSVINEIASCVPPIGLIICDEGHRLKSANNKTAALFKAIRSGRRVILSGTPIQNDLGEFHAMAEFCNPGLLDEYSTFRRVYELPILRSRDPDATKKEVEIGQARSEQLLAVAKSFVLRRDATLLKSCLPPKYEYVVFVTPTPLQLSIFLKILQPMNLDDLSQSSTAESLALINMLTKISNSPILLKATADHIMSKPTGNAVDTVSRVALQQAVTLLPERAQIDDVSLSGKLIALSRMLEIISKDTEEKCVLVSHFTSTLNILEAFCKKQGYSYHRLDGQTPQAKRQEYVNTFNKSSQRSSFIFLLSSKAGGVGINLIGASRLCLIDSDWNPSHDLQSMARCHRDGQKRPVFIYRFLTAGAIDEKIYQRQVTKLGLSESMMGTGSSSSKSDSFTKKDLRDIFRIHPGTACNTHDLLGCLCGGMKSGTSADGESTLLESEDDEESSKKGFIMASDINLDEIGKAEKLKKRAALASLGEWNHIDCLKPEAQRLIHDIVLSKLVESNRGRKMNVPSISKSRLDNLLSAIDLEEIGAMDESTRNIPGGTISYLFERSADITAEATA